jgi:hypothetical protein
MSNVLNVESVDKQLIRTRMSDDGTTYAYESGASSLTRLHWDDRAHRLGGAELGLVEVVGK